MKDTCRSASAAVADAAGEGRDVVDVGLGHHGLHGRVHVAGCRTRAGCAVPTARRDRNAGPSLCGTAQSTASAPSSRPGGRNAFRRCARTRGPLPDKRRSRSPDALERSLDPLDGFRWRVLVVGGECSTIGTLILGASFRLLVDGHAVIADAQVPHLSEPPRDMPGVRRDRSRARRPCP